MRASKVLMSPAKVQPNEEECMMVMVVLHELLLPMEHEIEKSAAFRGLVTLRHPFRPR